MGAEAACEPELQKDRPTVLVVEDEVLIRLMIADALRAHGLRVIEASNSDEALAVLHSALPVRLVITDIRMPSKMDGAVLARQVRRAHPHLKVIIASSHKPDDDLDGMADDFFCKPYNVSAVVERVKELLAGSQRAANRT